MDTFKDEGVTDIDESTEYSLAADTLIEASDKEDESEKETLLTSTITQVKLILKRESSIHKAI